MADVQETPVETPKEEVVDDGLYQFSSAAETPETEPEQEENKPETPAEEPAPEPVAKEEKPTHSAATLAVALERYNIPAEEAADMTPAELSRTMAYLERQTQKVWEAATRTAPKPEPKPEAKVEPAPEPEYDFVTNPLGLDDAVVKTLKKGAEAARQAKELKERLDRLEQQSQKSTAESVHKRIESLISEAGISEKFTRSSKAGEDAFSELLFMMGGVQQAAAAVGKTLTEPEIFNRALGAMGISRTEQKKIEKEVALKEREKEFDEGALAKTGTRKTEADVYSKVRDLLKKQKAPVAKEQVRSVAWL